MPADPATPFDAAVVMFTKRRGPLAAAVRSGVNGDPDFRRGAAMQQILDLSFAANELGTLKVG